jgi:hypothetical protein
LRASMRSLLRPFFHVRLQQVNHAAQVLPSKATSGEGSSFPKGRTQSNGLYATVLKPPIWLLVSVPPGVRAQ